MPTMIRTAIMKTTDIVAANGQLLAPTACW
jgi:hypothetical protein